MSGALNESVERLKAGCAVIDNGSVLLVINQYDGTLALPKGHIEKGEDPAAAAKRETLEETGQDVQLVAELEPIGYVSSRDGDPVRCRFWLAVLTGERSQSAGDKHYLWAPLDEAEDTIDRRHLPVLREALARLALQ